MQIITVVERDFRLCEDCRDRYIGGTPCVSFEGARELVYAHRERGNDISVENYIENGTVYAETSAETGEIVKEYYVKLLVSE